MQWWEELFSNEDRAAYESYTTAGPRLQKRGGKPALLVIDVVRSFVGTGGLSAAEAAQEWHTSCGPRAWESVPHIQALLQGCRDRGYPVVFTRMAATGHPFHGGAVKGTTRTNKTDLSRREANEFPPEIAPRPEEWILEKAKASAFFGTPLMSHLVQHQVDSLFISGCTTSGCVRSTVVDAFSWGYNTFVVEQACFDRSRLSEGVSLFEMNAKYADVISTNDALSLLK